MPSRRPPCRLGPYPEVPALFQPHHEASPPGRAQGPRQLTARRTPLPQPRPRCESSLQARAWATPEVRGVQGGHTPRPPYLWADPRLHLPRRCSSLQLRPLLLSFARLPGTCSSAWVLAKSEKERKKEKTLQENGTGPFKICLLPFPFALSAPFHRLVPKHRERRGGKEAATPSNGRNGQEEVKREGSQDDYLYLFSLRRV